MRCLRAIWQWVTSVLGEGELLCDRCKYDHPSACRRPQRPNATRCPDFRRR